VAAILRDVRERLTEVSRLLFPPPGGPWQDTVEADMALGLLTRWGFPTPRVDELGKHGLIPASDVGPTLAKLRRLAAGARLAQYDRDLIAAQVQDKDGGKGQRNTRGLLPPTTAFIELVETLIRIYEQQTGTDIDGAWRAANRSDSDVMGKGIGFCLAVLLTAKEELPGYGEFQRSAATLYDRIRPLVAKHRRMKQTHRRTKVATK
jgi:hypothetical protein